MALNCSADLKIGLSHVLPVASDSPIFTATARMGTITKALQLLDFFSREQPEIGLSQFQKLALRDKATVYRHLTELVDNGFLEQDQHSRNYRLGPAVLRLSNVRESTDPLRTTLDPLARQLSRRLNELVHVSVLQGDILATICYANHCSAALRVSFDESELLPLHATSSGYAVLAFGPGTVVDDVCAGKLQSFTEHTVTDADALYAVVNETRQRGYSLSTGIKEDGVASCAAPVFNSASEAYGAISVTFPTVRGSHNQLLTLTSSLLATARLATVQTGGQLPDGLEAVWSATDQISIAV